MAGNDDLDEGQRALSDGESVAVPSRDGSDSDDGAPKLPPAVRKLADTLSSGERDGAPSTAGLNPDAPRQRRKCAPVPKTPRPPRREGGRAAAQAGARRAQGRRRAAGRAAAPPASPPAKWRGSGDNSDDAMELLSDSDDEAPAAADDGDSDRDSEPARRRNRNRRSPSAALSRRSTRRSTRSRSCLSKATSTRSNTLENAGAWRGHEIIGWRSR